MATKSTKTQRTTDETTGAEISPQLKDLILQSLAHEKGGVKVYAAALECAQNDELEEEWQKYFGQTKEHVRVLTELCETLGLDPDEQAPSCEVVGIVGEALVAAMQKAKDAGDPAAAQIVACECVVLAETKDHLDWELLGKIADATEGPVGEAIGAAAEEIEDEEDEHLYHTKGWCRELWLDALGLEAKLPPPEEEKDVKTAAGAAKVESSRKHPKLAGQKSRPRG